MYRNPKVQKQYDEDRKTKEGGCVFCDLDQNIIVEKRDHFLIIKNIYPYGVWDLKEVEEHLMVVPKKHAEGFDEFDQESEEEYFEITKKYSIEGYDLFTRTTESSRKTQPHFHTHLIKTTGDTKKKLHFKSYPYFLEY